MSTKDVKQTKCAHTFCRARLAHTVDTSNCCVHKVRSYRQILTGKERTLHFKCMMDDTLDQEYPRCTGDVQARILTFTAEWSTLLCRI